MPIARRPAEQQDLDDPLHGCRVDVATTVVARSIAAHAVPLPISATRTWATRPARHARAVTRRGGD
jgi:hypothetical protein